VLGTEQEMITLQVDGQQVVIDFNDIAKAQLINNNGER
jgi:ribosome maturation factor RimP